MLRVLLLIIFGFLSFLPTTTFAAESDIDLIKSRAVGFYSAMGPSMEAEAQGFLNTMRPDGTWADLDILPIIGMGTISIFIVFIAWPLSIPGIMIRSILMPFK